MKLHPLGAVAIVVALLTSVRGDAVAEEAPGGAAYEEDLVKETQNPISTLISLPFQNNFNFGVGPGRKLQYVLNIQPVFPTTVGERCQSDSPAHHSDHRAARARHRTRGRSSGWATFSTSSTCLLTPKPASSGGSVRPFLRDRDRHVAWYRTIQHRTDRSCVGCGRAVGGRGARKPTVVFFGQPECTVGESGNDSAFHQLQLPPGMVLGRIASLDRELEGRQRREVEIPIGGGVGKLVRIWAACR